MHIYDLRAVGKSWARGGIGKARAQLRKRIFQFERYVRLDLRLYPGLGEW